tara:strand:+ start:1617 stop:1790 length:174 start_codon:yes stop_codon:yes gene_type:complete
MRMVLKLLRQILDEQKRTNRILGELARPRLGTMQLTQSWKGIRNKSTEALWDGTGDE